MHNSSCWIQRMNLCTIKMKSIKSFFCSSVSFCVCVCATQNKKKPNKSFTSNKWSWLHLDIIKWISFISWLFFFRSFFSLHILLKATNFNPNLCRVDMEKAYQIVLSTNFISEFFFGHEMDSPEPKKHTLTQTYEMMTKSVIFFLSLRCDSILIHGYVKPSGFDLSTNRIVWVCL